MSNSQFILSTSSTSIASQLSVAQQFPQHTFHPDGNIIVSADYTGQIKVFRQDCAWAQRKVDSSDTASIRLRGKSKASSSSMRPTGILNFRSSNTTVSRTGSTRSSSRRNSIETFSLPPDSGQTGLSKNLEIPKSTPIPHANGPGNSQLSIRSRQSSTAEGRTQSYQDRNQLAPPSPGSVTPKKLTPQERLLLQEDGQSLAFYHVRSRQDSIYSDRSRSASVSPERYRSGSISSGHSEKEMGPNEARSFVDAEERLSNDNMVCQNCGARTFNAFKVQNGPLKGETKLRCSVYEILQSRVNSSCKHVFD
jgi:WD repeat-containing protein 44